MKGGQKKIPTKALRNSYGSNFARTCVSDRGDNLINLVELGGAVQMERFYQSSAFEIEREYGHKNKPEIRLDFEKGRHDIVCTKMSSNPETKAIELSFARAQTTKRGKKSNQLCKDEMLDRNSLEIVAPRMKGNYFVEIFGS